MHSLIYLLRWRLFSTENTIVRRLALCPICDKIVLLVSRLSLRHAGVALISVLNAVRFWSRPDGSRETIDSRETGPSSQSTDQVEIKGLICELGFERFGLLHPTGNFLWRWNGSRQFFLVVNFFHFGCEILGTPMLEFLYCIYTSRLK